MHKYKLINFIILYYFFFFITYLIFNNIIKPIFKKIENKKISSHKFA